MVRQYKFLRSRKLLISIAFSSLIIPIPYWCHSVCLKYMYAFESCTSLCVSAWAWVVVCVLRAYMNDVLDNSKVLRPFYWICVYCLQKTLSNHIILWFGTHCQDYSRRSFIHRPHPSITACSTQFFLLSILNDLFQDIFLPSFPNKYGISPRNPCLRQIIVLICICVMYVLDKPDNKNSHANKLKNKCEFHR